MYKLTKWTKLILPALCFVLFIGMLNRHPDESKNIVTLKFLDYTNRIFLEEFFTSLEDELAYSNGSFTKNLPICFGDCLSNDKERSQSVVDNFELKFTDKECRTRYLLLENKNSWRLGTLQSLSQAAKDSFPCYLHLNSSKIPKANRGVFTKVSIPEGVIFGPYTGVKRKLDGEEGDKAKNGGFAWKIEDESSSFFIDGADESKSNWLRFVNSARFAEEQNLYPMQMDKGIYYYVMQDIPAGKELLVWYGSNYAKNMGIVFDEKYNDNLPAFALAPKRELVTCASC